MPSVDDELVWKGEWAEDEAYVELDVVFVGATAYVCVDAHTASIANEPPNADFWELLVPLSNAYASVQDYLSASGKTITTANITIARQLAAASRVFDRETGQFFSQDGAPVARIFKAKYYDRLDLDYEGNCPGIATRVGLSIQVDESGAGDYSTAWATTDYDLHPMQSEFGPEPTPWNTIMRRRNGLRSFIVGNDVKVTAVYGGVSIPSAVTEDVILLARIWRREAPQNAVDELGMTITEASLLRRWRDAYRKQKVTF